MYIYADLTNGYISVAKGQCDLDAIKCASFEDAESELKNLNEENFEILLKVNNEIYAQIDSEYGIK